MPFEIIEEQPRDLIPDWFRDQSTAADDAQMWHDYGYHLIGTVRKYRSAHYARRFFWMNQDALREVSERHPEVFDEFICAYAEALLG